MQENNSIEQQIEALTQELRPAVDASFFYIDEYGDVRNANQGWLRKEEFLRLWNNAVFASTNKAEVEEYADCYRGLKLYGLMAVRDNLKYPTEKLYNLCLVGTDFEATESGMVQQIDILEGESVPRRRCVLWSTWFKSNKDRLKALTACGIDADFQKRCAKYGLGGA